MKLNDAVFGLLLLALGSFVLVSVQSYPQIPGQKVGPSIFPGLIATGLCIGGLILLVKGWARRTAEPWFAPQAWMKSPRHVLAFALLIGSVLFYMAVSHRLGFLITSTLILSLLFSVLKVRLGKALLIAVLASLVIHFAFYKLLRVPLPWGVLQNYAW